MRRVRRGTRAEVSVGWAVDRLIGVVVHPIGWAVAAPRVALDVVGASLQTVGVAREVVTQAAVLLPGLVRLSARLERVLDVLERPAPPVAPQFDEPLLEGLLRSAWAAPGLVASVQQALDGFDVFLARADGVRDMAADVTGRASDLTAQVAGLLSAVSRVVDLADTTTGSAVVTAGRADMLVTDVEILAARAAQAVGAAEGVVEGGHHVLQDAREIVTRVTEVVGVAGVVAVQAQQLAGTVEDLTGQAQPVIETSVELAEQATEPVRTLLRATAAAAPALADLTPDLVAALAEFTERLPALLHSLDTQVLPTLSELRRLPHDVRALKDSVEGIEPKLDDMAAELAGLPGAKLLRRRGRRPEPDLPGVPGPAAGMPTTSGSPTLDRALGRAAPSSVEAVRYEQ